MTAAPALVWLRDDLRLDDQPAIAAAANRPALYVYIFDDKPALRALGGAAKWWLGRSLQALGAQMAAIGGRLDILRGDSGAQMLDIAKAARSPDVFWTRRYGGAEIAHDAGVKQGLIQGGAAPKSFNGQLLREPWEAANAEGAAFRVFSAFWRRHRALGEAAAPAPAPARLTPAPWPASAPARVAIEDLGLTPSQPNWSGGLAATWSPGERGAQTRLDAFCAQALSDYANARDRPDGLHTSMLSPHLRFGEISPRRIFHTLAGALASGAAEARAVEKFQSEIGWREFAYSLLYAFPDLATRNWQEKFDAFANAGASAEYRAWTKGLTGYPIVDAGMRELWATGYMHNRVRMVAASFLIKHLLIDWRRGEQWFWDTLCDADPANNPASWQWVAGSGADAAPYYRIFNPILQGQKFDAAGAYVRRWAPELARLETQYIHAPWLAPATALRDAGVVLGQTYPAPIIDHDFARRRALAALAATKIKA